jgi:hypothetical protein
MDLKSLKAKQASISASFDESTTEKQTHTDKIAELDVELVRLQGEYRLIQELIDNLKESKNGK